MNYIQNLQVSAQLSATDYEKLEVHFENLCKDFALSQSTIAQYKTGLFQAHQAPQRHYHNLSHLHNMAVLLEQHAQQKSKARLLQLAIWYHDSIYDAASKENETQSAELMQTHWQPYLSPAQCEIVYTTIKATAKHKPYANTLEELLFLDLDLAVLAAEPFIYQQYYQAIEQEYLPVYPLEIYRIGRRQVLQHFLKRPRIYFSAAFESYEAAARNNLEVELSFLA